MDVFSIIQLFVLAKSEINASMRISRCTSNFFASASASIFAILLVGHPLLTDVAGKTFGLRDVAVGRLGRRADIVNLPNVGVSEEQISTALGVVKVVIGKLESGH